MTLSPPNYQFQPNNANPFGTAPVRQGARRRGPMPSFREGTTSGRSPGRSPSGLQVGRSRDPSPRMNWSPASLVRDFADRRRSMRTLSNSASALVIRGGEEGAEDNGQQSGAGTPGTPDGVFDSDGDGGPANADGIEGARIGNGSNPTSGVRGRGWSVNVEGTLVAKDCTSSGDKRVGGGISRTDSRGRYDRDRSGGRSSAGALLGVPTIRHVRQHSNHDSILEEYAVLTPYDGNTSDSVTMNGHRKHSSNYLIANSWQEFADFNAGVGASDPPFSTNTPVFSGEQKWLELGLWQEEPEAWSYAAKKEDLKELHTKDVKRQDIMYELIITEKHHCRTLVILKQTYFQTLLNKFDPSRIAPLMPQLDQLLDVHYEFFRALRARQGAQGSVMETIHDILVDHFTGEMGDRFLQAYAEFCFRKDAAVAEYHRLRQTNNQFGAIISDIISKPLYKDKSLPDCLLKVAQRPTKYHVLVEQLRKYTRAETGQAENAQAAEDAVKRLLTQINSSVDERMFEAARHDIHRKFDSRSVTSVTVGTSDDKKSPLKTAKFTRDELINPSRRLLNLGSVFWRNARQKLVPVEMLLMTDMIVFLEKTDKGDKTQYSFFTEDNKCCVVPLRKLLVREKAGRFASQGLYLIAPAPMPEMYEIMTENKKELAKWLANITKAVQKCQAAATADDEGVKPWTPEAAPEEDEVDETQLAWDEIIDILRASANETCAIDSYFKNTTKYYRRLRDALEQMDLRGNKVLCQKLTDHLCQHFTHLLSSPGSIRELTQWPNLLILQDLTAYIRGQASARADVPKRAETFHGVGDSKGARPKGIKKHHTVTGVCPDARDAITAAMRHSASNDSVILSSMAGAPDSACREVTERLLERLGLLEHDVASLKSDKILLEAELGKFKDKVSSTSPDPPSSGSGITRQSTAPTGSGGPSRSRLTHRPSTLPDFGTQLEVLRQKEAELSSHRSALQREVKDRQDELEIREKRISEKESTLAKIEEDIGHKWNRLAQVWESYRLQGVPLTPLTSSANHSGDQHHLSGKAPRMGSAPPGAGGMVRPPNHNRSFSPSSTIPAQPSSVANSSTQNHNIISGGGNINNNYENVRNNNNNHDNKNLMDFSPTHGPGTPQRPPGTSGAPVMAMRYEPDQTSAPLESTTTAYVKASIGNPSAKDSPFDDESDPFWTEGRPAGAGENSGKNLSSIQLPVPASQTSNSNNNKSTNLSDRKPESLESSSPPLTNPTCSPPGNSPLRREHHRHDQRSPTSNDRSSLSPNTPAMAVVPPSAVTVTPSYPVSPPLDVPDHLAGAVVNEAKMAAIAAGKGGVGGQQHQMLPDKLLENGPNSAGGNGGSNMLQPPSKTGDANNNNSGIMAGLSKKSDKSGKKSGIAAGVNRFASQRKASASPHTKNKNKGSSNNGNGKNSNSSNSNLASLETGGVVKSGGTGGIQQILPTKLASATKKK